MKMLTNRFLILALSQKHQVAIILTTIAQNHYGHAYAVNPKKNGYGCGNKL